MTSRRLGAVCVAVVAALALTGCLRQTASYTVSADDTVSGRIYKALHLDYIDETDPFQGTGVDDIAATFTNVTVTPHNEGEWRGYYVDFMNEPLASFADPVTENWDIQILKTDATYRAYGYTPTASDEGVRNTITDEGGYLELWVTFPGALVEAPAAAETGTVGTGPASWALFNLLTIPIDTTPYARGMGASAVTPDPDPDPVVTVVITPEPDPEVTPAPTATPTLTTGLITPADGDEGSIPAWVWAAGGALVLALAGLIGYTFANRKPKIPAAAATPEPVADKTPEAPKDEAPKK